LTKHLRVDALEDKVLFSCGVHGHQEGLIDIAIPKFPDVCNLTDCLKSFCNGKKIIHGLTSGLEICAA
jgi:hypothetical protein